MLRYIRVVYLGKEDTYMKVLLRFYTWVRARYIKVVYLGKRSRST